MLRLIFALALVLLAGGSVLAEEDGVGDALDGLSGTRMLEYVKALAADEMQGRRTGFAGGQKAENWVIARMSEFGLHPADAGGTYLEPFTFRASEVTAPIVLKVGDKALAYGHDFAELLQTGAGNTTAEVVFCGYGISRPDLGWDDYSQVNVKGRIVLALRGAPRARAAEFGHEAYIGQKVKTAAGRGAAGFLLVDGEKALVGAIAPQFLQPRFPALWVSRAVADSILAPKQKTVERLRGQRDAGNPAESFATGTKVTIDLKAKWHAAAKGHNALGAIHGRDPDLKHEIVLVTAHMDHLGVGPEGTVFNGADDNASGVAVMTHLADIVTANRWKPKRTIIFCAFGAEEQGLVGATALATRYPFEGRIVCVLNMDMVGQGEPALYVAGGGSYPWMGKRLKAYLPEALRAKTTFSARVGDRGDHWPFYERGIPAFFIRTKGAHPQYHTPEDDADNVKPECLEAAARTVGTLLVKLGGCTEKLEMPGSFYHYLLREGPVWGSGQLHEGRIVSAQPVLPEDTVSSAWIVNVPASAAREQWAALVKLEAGGAHRLVRRAADIGRAWHEGKTPLLPHLLCGPEAAENPQVINEYAKIGYRLMSPFGKGASPAAVAQVAKEARVLLRLHGSAAERRAAMEALGAWPSVMVRGPDDDAALGRGGNVLLLVGRLSGAQLTASLGTEPQVLVGGFTQGETGGPDATSLAKILGEWQSATKPGWWLPGTPQRGAIRAVLGGRIVEWLQRAERLP